MLYSGQILNSAPEYAPEELNHSMASTTKWVINLRQSIKNTCGTGWSVRGRESKGELITQVTFRYPDNQGRTAANVNLAWNAKNTTKIITAVEALNDLMTQKNLSLQKAVELRMEPMVILLAICWQFIPFKRFNYSCSRSK